MPHMSMTFPETDTSSPGRPQLPSQIFDTEGGCHRASLPLTPGQRLLSIPAHSQVPARAPAIPRLTLNPALRALSAVMRTGLWPAGVGGRETRRATRRVRHEA